jgi:hypothetical protein
MSLQRATRLFAQIFHGHDLKSNFSTCSQSDSPTQLSSEIPGATVRLKVCNLAAAIAGLMLAACEETEATPLPSPESASAVVKGAERIIALCGPQSGQSFYPEVGMVSGKDAGWTADKISVGVTALVENEVGELDLKFIDATKRVYSTVEDGGSVTLFRQGPGEVTVLAGYPGSTIEIYQFLRTSSGFQMLQLQSKGGEGPLYKASLLVAACSQVDFDI